MNKIERIGKTTGRFPSYRFVVDGVDIGHIKRKVVKGKDGNVGRSQPAYDVWAIHGTECGSQVDAEATLLDRAYRFGYIK